MLKRSTENMGWWGSGNLENDGSSDFLVGMSESHFERIEELLGMNRATQFDEDEYYELFCTIEVVCALHCKGLIYWAPKPRSIEKLFRPYLKRLYRYESPDAERKKAIKSSFACLTGVLRDLKKSADGASIVQIDEETMRTDPRYKDIADIFSILDKPEADE